MQPCTLKYSFLTPVRKIVCIVLEYLLARARLPSQPIAVL